MGTVRTAGKASPRHVAQRLSEEERRRILLTCNQPEYASLPPGQIVPALADQDLFIGSESSFYRVLHQAGQCQRWYNHQHRHSGIKFVTPHQRHSGHAVELCRRRAHVYEKARQKHPRRWSRSTRCWRQPEVVWINKPPEEPESTLAVPLIQVA
jgi:hypothetical protein